jgi:glycosyltransferase involved in cell wall biosynthesis
MILDVIIPAYNEAGAIGLVVSEIPRAFALPGVSALSGEAQGDSSQQTQAGDGDTSRPTQATVRHVVVVDNGSTDNTSAVARAAGAVVLREDRPGYGNACLRGMDYLAKLPEGPPDTVVFLDGDHSDYPEQMPELVAPIASGEARMVIGSRALGQAEKGSLTPQQIWGNRLAVFLLRVLYGVRYTDLGPFRAIDWASLQGLGMVDRNYGWTVEMQVKAAKQGLPATEVPVRYRQRIGTSKVSGTVRGTFGAGYKILLTIFRYL